MSQKNSIKDIVIIVLLSLSSFFIATIVMALSFNFIASMTEVNSEEEVTPISFDDAEDEPLPEPALPRPKPASKKPPLKCESTYFAVFRKEDSALCAITNDDVIYAPSAGPPNKVLLPEGFVITESELTDSRLCACLVSQPGYKETFRMKRISSLRLSDTEFQIEKWVCGDLCQDMMK
ncbi:MAG: hypothetical protein VSS75_006190 [Candidatus Parabeggiatoa sp.]|nr:hypothetical protein [Candidatus Parabeggiatoa sp.]